MTDYKDLAFKPPMTWEELCEYAHDRGALLHGNWFYFNRLNFAKDGSIRYAFTPDIAKNRTYEQMKNIIDNLYGE